MCLAWIVNKNRAKARELVTAKVVNAGVPQELRMKLTGHSSTEMNAAYSHHERAVIRGALEHLPRLVITKS